MISGSEFFNTFYRTVSVVLLAIYTLLSTTAHALTYSNTVEIAGFSVTGWGDAAEMQVVGNRMYYVYSNSYGEDDSPSALQIYDISNPELPVLLGEEPAPIAPVDVTIEGSYAYIADRNAGLRIVDVSDSATPIEIGFFEASENESMHSVAIKGQVVYTGSPLVGLRAIDVSNPEFPSAISIFSAETHSTSDLYVEGNRLYVIGSELIIFDISTPSTPILIGSHDFGTSVTGIDIDGATVYATRYSGAPDLEILDVTNPASISAIGTLTFDVEEFGRAELEGVTVVDNLAYLTGANLRVVDVSNPASPKELGLIALEDGFGITHPVQIAGNFAYASIPSVGIRATQVPPSLRQPIQAEEARSTVPTSIDSRQTDAGDQFQPPANLQTPTPLAPSVLQSPNDREPAGNDYAPSKSSDGFRDDFPTRAVDRGTPNYADERDSYDTPDRGTPTSQDSYSQDSFDSSDSYDANAYSSARTNTGASGPQFDSDSDPSTAERASSTPGPKHLDGLQTPSIALQKQAPPEIQVGKPATFIVKVQNVGQVLAEEVTVFDRVPQGTRFLDASPQAERRSDDTLIWRLGNMKPGEEKTISIELQPQVEGEIGSVARVSFESQVSVRTVCTRPQLELQLTAPPKVLIGQTVAVGIRISNPGTGAAENVILEENVPEEFSHPAGGELEFEVGTLRPGESRTATLTMRAEKAGIVENVVDVRGAGDLAKQEKVTIEVVAPDLDIAISGPTKRFLERRADYSLALGNPGTAPARNVEMVAFLHKGMKFIEANNQGHYDQQNHAVYWSLEELPAGERGNVKLSVLPIETGKQRLRVESRADLGIQKSDDHEVSVDGLASLFFDVVDSADPIEIGSDTVYRVRIINQGSKAATNVKLFAALPGGLKPIGADGPSGHQINGQSVLFDAIARLEPKAEALFKIQARGTQAGRQQIRIQMVSDSPTNTGQTDPVSKEESTLVYSDR